MIRHRPALASLAATLVLGLAGAAPSVAGPGPGGGPEPATYTNPVSAGFADTYADPAVIRGKDGWWYAYGTTDPLREGEGTRHLLPISRSQDLVDWQYVGDAFTEESRPDWADRTRDAALWAPDIRYVDGEYRLYYVVTETTVPGINDNAIGVATAPTPTGPWTDSGSPVVGPRSGSATDADNWFWTFDPHHVTTQDGTEYLFYGSYYGGIWVTELNEDGTAATGTPTQVAINDKYEGSYVIQRDGWWYLFASSANCCAGPATGYSVYVGRSRDVTGPYVDRQGIPLTASRAGSTPVLTQNGNAWIGAGHNAVVTDLAGQDWIVYHAIDRADPWLDAPFGINERPMLIDRLDWIDGWPLARAGAGPSQDPQLAPVTSGLTVTDFSGGLRRAYRQAGPWATGEDPQSGRYAATTGASAHLLLTRSSISPEVRVEADLRQAAGATGSYGLVAAARWQLQGPKARSGRGTGIFALIDPATGMLTVRAVDRGETTAEKAVPIPAGHTATWHNLALEVRHGVATAELTEARLNDPLASVSVVLPARTRTNGQAGAYASSGGVHLDNLSALRAAELVTEAVPEPTLGMLLPEFSDEFGGTEVGPGWTEIRDPRTTLAGGQLVWPTEAADLVGIPVDPESPTTNNAGLLLREPPAGDWTVETKLTIDLGEDTVRNFQQGGLIVHVGDDLFARLSHVAIWNTRQTEFGKELPVDGSTAFGGTIVGPPAETTWLRIARTTNDEGEHVLRASTSNDGSFWVHGGAWTLPADADPRVGLISHGGAGATSLFDYLRFYAD